ncbi:hypothetical protein AVEN_136434-1, partial [Araneus ventricosus]
KDGVLSCMMSLKSIISSKSMTALDKSLKIAMKSRS